MIVLTIVTLLLALVLLGKGIFSLMKGPLLKEPTLELLYDRKLAIGLWSAAIIWTLIEVLKLGPADFGSYKVLLFVLFGGMGIGAVWMLRDYLIVRAVSVLWLYLAWWLLQAAYMQPQWTRLFVVFLVYVGIVKALWLAVAPWRARQFVNWLYKKPIHYKSLSWVYIAYGLLLAVVGATYSLV